MLDKYSSQIPICLHELEQYDLISFDQYFLEITMTVKGAEFLNLYNDLKELVCLDNNLDLWRQNAYPNIHVIVINILGAKKC